MTQKKKKRSKKAFSDNLDNLLNLGATKDHLVKAGHEVLLASQGLIGMVKSYCNEKKIEQSCPQLHQLILSTESTIAQAKDGASKSAQMNKNRVKAEVISAIVEALEKELNKTKRSKNLQKKKLQLEVLGNVIEVLLRQLN
ncbi:hypothetical protein KKA47_05015 [bacterium]|nr:hypothetical protein [bacterium]